MVLGGGQYCNEYLDRTNDQAGKYAEGEMMRI
jgi:hypothetical protein